MSWFRLEGRGAFHHKVLAAGNEAYGAWCRAGQWSSDQLTDGFVPRAVAEQIAKPKVWAKLVEARLLDEAEGGYQIHDYLDWNPSSEQERVKRDALREKRREAGRAGGKRSGEVRRGEADPKQQGSTDEANAKQSASTGASLELKQNEPPNPIPIPIPREETNTPPAGTRAHEDRTIAPSCSEADLAALLAGIEVLVEVAADKSAVHEVYTGFVMACGDTASVELARAALGVLIARERLTDLSPDGKRERVGTYLANARRYNRLPVDTGERPSEPARTSDEARVVLEVFAEVWEKRKGTPFVRAAGDERKAAELVEPARATAERLGVRPREVVRHAAEGYVRDAEPFVADKEHPFALFAARFGQYGTPRAKKPTVDFRPSEPAKAPEPPAAPPPPDWRQQLAAVGTNGNAMRRPS